MQFRLPETITVMFLTVYCQLKQRWRLLLWPSPKLLWLKYYFFLKQHIQRFTVQHDIWYWTIIWKLLCNFAMQCSWQTRSSVYRARIINKSKCIVKDMSETGGKWDAKKYFSCLQSYRSFSVTFRRNCEMRQSKQIPLCWFQRDYVIISIVKPWNMWWHRAMIQSEMFCLIYSHTFYFYFYSFLKGRTSSWSV